MITKMGKTAVGRFLQKLCDEEMAETKLDAKLEKNLEISFDLKGDFEKRRKPRSGLLTNTNCQSELMKWVEKEEMSSQDRAAFNLMVKEAGNDILLMDFDAIKWASGDMEKKYKKERKSARWRNKRLS